MTKQADATATSPGLPPIAGLILAVVLLLGDAYLVRLGLRLRDARDRYVPVPATVLSSELAVHSGESTSYRPDVRFRYEVDGVGHVGVRHSFWRAYGSDRDHAADVVARYPPGAEVVAYVDPDDPGESVLDISSAIFPWFALLLLAPFHSVDAWLLASAARNRRAARAGERPVRRAGDAPWEVFLLGFTGFTLLAAVGLGFTLGLHGSGPYVLPALGAAAVGAAIAAAVRLARGPAAR